MMANELPRFDVRDRLGQITMPTLVIDSRYDWATQPSQVESIHAGLPDSTLVLFEESGHMPMVEQAQEYVDAVRRHLG